MLHREREAVVPFACDAWDDTSFRTPEAERPDLQSALGRALQAIALTEQSLLLGNAVIGRTASFHVDIKRYRYEVSSAIKGYLQNHSLRKYPTQPARCSVLLENLLVHSDQAHHTLLRHGFSKSHPVL